MKNKVLKNNVLKNVSISLCLLGTFLLAYKIIYEKNEKDLIYPLSIALDWSPNTNHIGLFLGKALKEFESQKLSVQVVEMSLTSPLVLVSEQKVSFAFSFLNEVIQARAQGMDLVVLAGVVQKNPNCLVWKDSAIQGVEDFEGRTYAGWGGKEEEQTLRYLMRHKGKNPDKLKILVTGSSDFLTTVPHMADIMWIFLGWTGMKLKEEHISYHSYCPSDEFEIFDHPSPLLVTSKAFLESNQEVTKDFLAILKKEYLYASQNPKEASMIFARYLNIEDTRLIEDSLNFLQDKFVGHAPYWGYMDEAKVRAYIDWMYEEKLILTKEDPKKFINLNFVEEN
jgi:ABC-type nitrate/sulfonate/bicarbonate transport system substrate-binding protein